MDLKRLRYFCAVVEHGNITRAASVLHISQPPLSKRLQELEDEMGTPLFIRQGGRIGTTPAGFFLYKKASKILQELEDAHRETLLLAKNETKILRIGLTHLFQDYFKPLIMEMHYKNPGVKLGISVSDSSHLERLLNDGLIDVAMIQRPDKMAGYDCMSFSTINLVAVINKKLLPDSDCRAMAFSALEHFPLILLRRASGVGTFEHLTNALSRNGTRPNVLMYIAQPTVILDWLESGVKAASLLPASEVHADRLHNCRVVKVLPVPQVFFPSIVKLTSTPQMKELMTVLKNGYPF